MSKNSIKSVEPNIADYYNNQLKSYNLDYMLEQESLNSEIDRALDEYFSKNGGIGGNRPDCKLLLEDKNMKKYPVLIEYKGYKDKLVKLNESGQVDNKKQDGTMNFSNINGYAVNGAVHYANALLHLTSYSEVISIGITGYRDEKNELKSIIGVYFVSKSNYGIGQKIKDYTDLSFLKKENFDKFIQDINEMHLTDDELVHLREIREKEIDISIQKLNEDIYQNETNLAENDRVYLVAASVMATLGIPGKVSSLEKCDLKSSTEENNTDGEIIIRKISVFLKEKNLQKEKIDMIIRTLSNTLLNYQINKPENGESQLKRIFCKIVDNLGIYYKIGLTTDFTGKLFNTMYSWLGFTQDKLNDVVLTPSYVATLLVKLARVNKDSYVWDFATGSAGLLVAAMNEMLRDAKEHVNSYSDLETKKIEIKSNQLLGIELLPDIYMLAILNMILIGDGSLNILNIDSLKDYNGTYDRKNDKFPANAFILNPPLSLV